MKIERKAGKRGKSGVENSLSLTSMALAWLTVKDTWCTPCSRQYDTKRLAGDFGNITATPAARQPSVRRFAV